MLVTGHVAEVTLLLIKLTLGLRLQKMGNRKITVLKYTIKVCDRLSDSRGRMRWKRGTVLGLCNQNRPRYVHRSLLSDFGRSRSCCRGRGCGCPGTTRVISPSSSPSSTSWSSMITSIGIMVHLVCEVTVEHLSGWLRLTIGKPKAVKAGMYQWVTQPKAQRMKPKDPKDLKWM